MGNQRNTSGNAEHVLKVTILDNSATGNPGRKSIVKPGHCRVKNSDSVTWEANDSDIKLFFPNPNLFGIREKEITKGSSFTRKVNENVSKGQYPYSIYCHESNDFAEGGSFPIIIVH